MEVNYGSVDKAVATMSRGCFLFVVDLADAFFNWRVSSESTWDLGFYSPKRQQFGIYEFLPFGLSPSPGINDKCLKEILRLLEQHEGVKVFISGTTLALFPQSLGKLIAVSRLEALRVRFRGPEQALNLDLRSFDIAALCSFELLTITNPGCSVFRSQTL